MDLRGEEEEHEKQQVDEEIVLPNKPFKRKVVHTLRAKETRLGRVDLQDGLVTSR